jgi:DNA replication protein DnaC
MKNNNEDKIGKRKYEALKSFDLINLTEESIEIFNNQFSISIGEAIKQVASYEKSMPENNPEFIEANKAYMNRVRGEVVKKEPIVLTKDMLWRMFKKAYLENEGKQFNYSHRDTLENIKPLIYYFLGDYENFAKCSNVSLLSEPSLKKGILIIGGYGNGKTSIMRAFEKCFIGSNLAFKGFTTNKLVEMYEGLQNPLDKEEFNKITRSGIRYFDDVLTEREASNYGKTNLIKDILEERYNNKLRTYISMNFKDKTNKDLEIGILQLSDKYGDRIYDRVFDMFNIIEFKGNSFRV